MLSNEISIYSIMSVKYSVWKIYNFHPNFRSPFHREGLRVFSDRRQFFQLSFGFHRKPFKSLWKGLNVEGSKMKVTKVVPHARNKRKKCWNQWSVKESSTFLYSNVLFDCLQKRTLPYFAENCEVLLNCKSFSQCFSKTHEHVWFYAYQKT